MRTLMLLLLGLLLAFPAHAGPKVIIKKPSEAQCKLLIDSLKHNLEAANYCRTDSDCIAASLGCPLPCFSPLNKGEDLSKFAGVKENYDQVCGSCTYKCAAPEAEPACVEGKCVVR